MLRTQAQTTKAYKWLIDSDVHEIFVIISLLIYSYFLTRSGISTFWLRH